MMLPFSRSLEYKHAVNFHAKSLHYAQGTWLSLLETLAGIDLRQGGAQHAHVSLKLGLPQSCVAASLQRMLLV
jgi:hypothetical protein